MHTLETHNQKKATTFLMWEREVQEYCEARYGTRYEAAKATADDYGRVMDNLNISKLGSC